MWDLWQASKAFQQRPSALFGIDPVCEDILAYDFDQAILLFGRWIDGKLDEYTGKGKNRKKKYKLEDLLKVKSATRFSIAAMTRAAGGTLLMGGPVG